MLRKTGEVEHMKSDNFDLFVRKGAFTLGFLLMLIATGIVMYYAWYGAHSSLDPSTALIAVVIGGAFAAAGFKLVTWSRP
jgi:hypothetical protein